MTLAGEDQTGDMRGARDAFCMHGVCALLKNKDNPDGMQINAENCVYGRTCDIINPTQYIAWTPP